MKWAGEKLENMKLNCKSVIFTNEKKFNLFASDGLNYYCHDLRRKPDEVKWGLQLRDRLMVWGAISYKESVGL